MKNAWYPIHKSLSPTFPFIQRWKLAEYRVSFVFLEIYRNITTRPSCTASCKNKGLWHYLRNLASTKKFTTISTSLSFSIKETWVLTSVTWIFGTLVHHLLDLLAFQVKSLFLASTSHLSLYCLSCSKQFKLRLSNISLNPRERNRSYLEIIMQIFSHFTGKYLKNWSEVIIPFWITQKI